MLTPPTLNPQPQHAVLGSQTWGLLGMTISSESEDMREFESIL